MRKLIALALLAFIVSGCKPEMPLTISGACGVFEEPGQPIRGANRQSQRWIDTTIERGIAACNWTRPKAGTALPRVVKP